MSSHLLGGVTSTLGDIVGGGSITTSIGALVLLAKEGNNLDKMYSNQLMLDKKKTVPVNAAGGNTVTLDVGPIKNKPLQNDGLYMLHIYNPSTETDITFDIFNKWTNSDGTTNNGKLNDSAITVAMGSGVDNVIQGLFIGDLSMVMEITNSAANTVAFDVQVSVRKI